MRRVIHWLDAYLRGAPSQWTLHRRGERCLISYWAVRITELREVLIFGAADNLDL